MTLDDLELYKFEFSENFSGFRQISDATTAKRMKIDHCQRHVVSTSNWQFWHALASRGFVGDSWAFLLPYDAWRTVSVWSSAICICIRWVLFS